MVKTNKTAVKKTEPIKIEVAEKVKTPIKFETLPSWALAYYKLKALFGDDCDLIISPVDDDKHECTITSTNYHKLVALSRTLKPEIDGLKIRLVNSGLDNEYAQTINDVFKGNRHFSNVRIAEEAHTGTKHILTTFRDETIQYKADNRFVPDGYETTLAEDLVKDLFTEEFLRSVYVTEEKSNCFIRMGDSICYDNRTLISDCINNTDSIISIAPGTTIKVGK